MIQHITKQLPQLHARTAVDDIIERGSWQDWVNLGNAALRDYAVVENIKAVTLHVEDKYLQRHRFWAQFTVTLEQEHVQKTKTNIGMTYCRPHRGCKNIYQARCLSVERWVTRSTF